MNRSAIPATVIGGYLGAGKTTLVNHLLANSEGRRIGVLVNDIGAVSIDAALIASQTDDLISLANGCVCCSLRDGFGEALDRLRPLPLDAVLIESSGVADPAAIAAHVQTPGFDYSGTVVVVDCSTIATKLGDRFVGSTVARQLTAADLIVLNKTDLVDDVSVAVRLIRLHAPTAPILPVRHAAIGIAEIFGLEPSASPSQPFDSPTHPTETLTWSGALDDETFRSVLDAIPEHVVRAKGIFDLASSPNRRTVVQLVGRRRNISAGEPWLPGEPRTSVLILISSPTDARPIGS